MTSAEVLGFVNFLIAFVCGPGALAAALFAVGRSVKVFAFLTIAFEAVDRGVVGYLRLLDESGNAVTEATPYLIFIRLGLLICLILLVRSLYTEWAARRKASQSQEQERVK